jgi:hypothetical protein
MGQGITDETDFIEGMLFYADPQENDTHIAMLQTQRARLLDMSKRHGLRQVKPFRVGDWQRILARAKSIAHFSNCSRNTCIRLRFTLTNGLSFLRIRPLSRSSILRRRYMPGRQLR